MFQKKIPFSLKISFLYLVFGAIWILFSDKALLYFENNTDVITKMQLYKGWFFILVTAIMLYVFIRNENKKRTLLINELQEANKKANESDLLKTAFLRNLSHYIRTPMNSILGFAELLEQRNIDEDKRTRFYNLINQQSQHLLHFINNIVDISKIQSGQLEVSRKYFHINECLRKLYKDFLIYRDENEKKIKILFEPGLSDDNDILFTDENKIRHILTNLVTNSINYTHEGEVVLGYYNESDKIIFYVKDSGPGLPKWVMDKLFKGFLFSIPSEIKVSQGFGLGLYLSANLVNLLNGQIWLDNTGTDGSKFCFAIPIENG